MSGWEIGDLALCVGEPEADLSLPPCGWRVVVGRTYTVLDYDGSPNGPTLNFEEDPTYDPYTGWDANAFRKILPDKHEACEAEFLTLLKRGKVKA